MALENDALKNREQIKNNMIFVRWPFHSLEGYLWLEVQGVRFNQGRKLESIWLGSSAVPKGTGLKAEL